MTHASVKWLLGWMLRLGVIAGVLVFGVVWTTYGW
jgi:hypothetical protein